MNASFELRPDKPAFLAWLERQQRKHDWKEGRFVQMTNVTKAHARIVANIRHTLGPRLDLDRWSVTAVDLGGEDADFIRIPDVVVEPMDCDDKGRRAMAPALLVEGLSPSSVAIDFTDEPEGYRRFSSLAAYVVTSQDEPICWVCQRTTPEGALPARPSEVRGREAPLGISGLGLTPPLAELYRGIAVEQ